MSTEPPKSPEPDMTPRQCAIFFAVFAIALFGAGGVCGWCAHRDSVTTAEEKPKEQIVSGPAAPVPSGPVNVAPTFIPGTEPKPAPKQHPFWVTWSKLRNERADLAKQLTDDETSYLCTIAGERGLSIDDALAVMRERQIAVYFVSPQVIVDDRTPEPNPKLWPPKNNFKPRSYQIPTPVDDVGAPGQGPGGSTGPGSPGPAPQVPSGAAGPGGAWPTPKGPGGR